MIKENNTSSLFFLPNRDESMHKLEKEDLKNFDGLENAIQLAKFLATKVFCSNNFIENNETLVEILKKSIPQSSSVNIHNAFIDEKGIFIVYIACNSSTPKDGSIVLKEENMIVYIFLV